MDFTKTFKDYSNTDLLKIIHNPNEYPSQAVETAKTIFASRQLSEEEIEIVKAELAIQQEGKEVKRQKINNIENKMKNIGTLLLNNVNPIQAETATAEKLIKIISIVFCGLFIFKIYKEFGMISFMFNEAKWDFSMMLYFLVIILRHFFFKPALNICIPFGLYFDNQYEIFWCGFVLISADFTDNTYLTRFGAEYYGQLVIRKLH